MTEAVEKWGVFEAAFAGPAHGNPFVDVTLDVEFARSNRKLIAPGFYDGDGVYRARLMPDTEGEWTYTTRSNALALNGLSGSFRCGPPGEGGHGPVQVRNKHHFAHADGKPYFPFGTTCYAWTHQPLDMQRQTLETMQSAGFNKLRMAVFPKHYIFNENEPVYEVYERGEDGALDFDRPNVVAFRHFETQIAALGKMGVEADVIVFHPYDRWGYCAMGLSRMTGTFAISRHGLAPFATSGGRSPTNTTSSLTLSRWPAGIVSSTSSRNAIRRDT